MKISKKTTFLVGVQLLPAMTPIVASADTISDVITKAHNAGLRVDVNDSTKRVQSKAEADRLNAEQRAKSEADAHALSAKIDKYLQDKRDAEEYNRTVVSEHDRAIEADQARIQDIRNGNLKIASDNAAAQEDYLRRLQEIREQNAERLRQHRAEVDRIRQEQDNEEREYQEELSRVRAENDKRKRDYLAALERVKTQNRQIEADLAATSASQGSGVSDAVRAQLREIDKAATTNAQRMATYEQDVARINAANQAANEQYLAAKRVVDEKNEQNRRAAEADNQRKNADYQRRLQEWEAEKRRLEGEHQRALDAYRTRAQAVAASNDAKTAANQQARQNWERDVANTRARNQQIDTQNQQAQANYERALAQYQQDSARIQNLPSFASSGTTSIKGNYNEGGRGSAAYFNQFSLYDPNYQGESLIEPITFGNSSQVSGVQGMTFLGKDTDDGWKFWDVTPGSSLWIDNVSRTASGESVKMKITVVSVGRPMYSQHSGFGFSLWRDASSFGFSVKRMDRISVKFELYTESGRHIQVPSLNVISDLDYEQGAKFQYSGGSVMTTSPGRGIIQDGQGRFWNSPREGYNGWDSAPEGTVMSAGYGDITYTHYWDMNTVDQGQDAVYRAGDRDISPEHGDPDNINGYYFNIFGRAAWLRVAVPPKPPVPVPHVEEPQPPTPTPLDPVPDAPNVDFTPPVKPEPEAPTVAKVEPLPPKPTLTPPPDTPPLVDIPPYPPKATPWDKERPKSPPPTIELLPEPPKPITDGLEPPEPDLIPEPKAPKPKPFVPEKGKDIDKVVYRKTPDKPDLKLNKVQYLFMNRTIWETIDGEVLRPWEDGEQPKSVFNGYEFVKTVKDNNGDTHHIYKPVPKNNVTTIWVTTTGEVLKPRQNGQHPKENFDGYEYVRTERDKDGNITHIYKPIPKVTTIWVTTTGEVLKPRQNGQHPKEDFDGYEFVRTDKDDNGNITHIYKPIPKPNITTVWVDDKGNILKPRTNGEHPHGDIPGYTYVRTERDKDGNLKHIFKKTPTPQITTIWVDDKGNVLKPRQNGEHPKENFDGYEFVRTDRDKDGNITHVYKPIPKPNMTTVWVDEDGNVLKPKQNGDHPHGDIPGYTYVRTERDKDGNVKHIFKKTPKITTVWVDEDGNVLKPRIDGEHPHGDIPGYTFVRTEKDENGNIKHIFKKTPTPEITTVWVDEDGNVLKPRINGEHPHGDIPGYTFVRTEKDENGNIKHIFKKTPTPEITTVWVDEDGNVLKPRTNGEHPHGDIPGYTFVRTETDENGNIKHIFKKTPQVRRTEDKLVYERPKELPKTGDAASLGFIGSALAGIGLFGSKRKQAKKRKKR